MAAKKRISHLASAAAKSNQPASRPLSTIDAGPHTEASAEAIRARKLQDQLERMRHELQSTIDELQSSNQELRVSNEEVRAINEQLQTTNNDLQAAREETIAANDQLQNKINELERANNDLFNLLDCTDIATVFLDRSLRIKLFSRAATTLFSIIPSDVVGRPLEHMMPRFRDPELIVDAARVLEQLEPVEKETPAADGRWWLRRIIPYHTRNHRIDGLVITFVDITGRKQAADTVVRRLAAIVEGSADAIFSVDMDGTIRTWNPGAERLYGYTCEEAWGRSVEMLIPNDRSHEFSTFMPRLKRGQPVEQFETERLRKDGERVPVAITISPIKNSEGQVISASAITRDIRERKAAEIALRQSEQRFRLMADSAPVLIWMSGANKLCNWFNKPWIDFVGRPMEQELGNGWTENIHTDDFERCLQTYDAAFEERQPFLMEYRLRRHDGTYRWIIDNGTPLYSEGGEFAGYIGSCIDITDRRQTEQALHTSESRYRTLFEKANDAIFLENEKDEIVAVNQRACELLGYSRDELLAMKVHDLQAPEVQGRAGTVIKGELENHGDALFEGLDVHRNGTRIPVEIANTVIEDSGRQLVLSIVRDITERKKAEQDLLASEQRLRAILDTATDAIVTIDYRGIIQSANAATAKMFGYAHGELIGQTVNQLMPSPHRESHDGYIARYLQTAEKKIIGTTREIDAQRKDGSIFPTELSVSEIEHLKLFTGIHRDLTERKQLERDVVEAASLEQRRIGQDLHDSVAQELTALSLLMNDLSESVQESSPVARKLTHRIAQGLERSQRELRIVLRGLLPVAVDSSGLMAALSDLADRIDLQQKVACRFDCPEPVSVADNLTATQIFLIAQEAVQNAVRHAKSQQIRITLNQKDGGVFLAVEDDGVGMPASSLESSGLGMRIMRNRAAIIGANLTIQPAQPTGTLVTCVLNKKDR
jgi:PAS domain S-box-containing protein